MIHNEFVPPTEHFQQQYSRQISRDPYYEPRVSDLLAADQMLTEIGQHDEQRLLPRQAIGIILNRNGFTDESLDQALETIPSEKVDELTTTIKSGLAKNNEIAREHQRKYEQYLSEYAKVLSLAADNGLPVDQNVALEALSAAQVHIVSRETAQRSGFEAGYAPNNGRLLFLDSYGDPSLDRYVAYHELTHAVTGLHVRRSIDGSSGLTKKAVHSGIRHKGQPGVAEDSPDARATSEYIRTAFDEIATDQIARILARAIETGVMPDFRLMTVAEFFDRTDQPDQGEARRREWQVVKAVFERIPESEKPIQKLLAMHFEYYNPTKPAGQRALARREFWQMADKFANINTVDRLVREYGYEAVNEYVASDKYEVDLRTKHLRNPKHATNGRGDSGPGIVDILTTLNKADRKSKTQARHNYQRRESSNRFRQSVSAMRAQNTDEYVTSTLAAMEARGMTPAQIKKAVAKQWHPDATGGDSRRAEYLKAANDKLSRRNNVARLNRSQEKPQSPPQAGDNRVHNQDPAPSSKEQAELTAGS